MINDLGRGVLGIEATCKELKASHDGTRQSILHLKQNMPVFSKDASKPGPSLQELDGLLTKKLAPLASGIHNLDTQLKEATGKMPAIPPHMEELLRRIEGKEEPKGHTEREQVDQELNMTAARPEPKALGSQANAFEVQFTEHKINQHVHEELSHVQMALVAEIRKETSLLASKLDGISFHQAAYSQTREPAKYLPSVIPSNGAYDTTGDFDSLDLDQLLEDRPLVNKTYVEPTSNSVYVPMPYESVGDPMPTMPSFDAHQEPDKANALTLYESFDAAPIQAVDDPHNKQVPEEGMVASDSFTSTVLEQQEEELREHQFDEDAHHKIVLREESSLASVFMSDEDVQAPVYDVTQLYNQTGICQALARSDRFSNFTVFIVVLNAIYIGIDADWNTAENIFDADPFFQIWSNFFCVYFLAEWIIRMMAFKVKCDAMKDGWFKFDAFLVITMVLDTWIIMGAQKLQGGDGVKIPVQPLRMLRLFKLTRMARLMRAFPELVTMIKGLIRSLRAISSSGILVGLMVYTWAILLHMLLKEEDELNEWLWEENEEDFTNLTNCMWMLIMQGTLMLDNAAPVMTRLLYHQKWTVKLAGLFFFIYTLLSALLILQMLIGVLCDVVSRVGQEQRDAQAIGIVKQELLEIITEADGGDGKISHEELGKVMKHPKSVAVLKKLNINRLFLMELQKMMFPKKTSTVPIKAVLELMIMCRGANPATVETLSGGFCFLASELGDLKCRLVENIKSMEIDLEGWNRRPSHHPMARD